MDTFFSIRNEEKTITFVLVIIGMFCEGICGMHF